MIVQEVASPAPAGLRKTSALRSMARLGNVFSHAGLSKKKKKKTSAARPPAPPPPPLSLALSALVALPPLAARTATPLPRSPEPRAPPTSSPESSSSPSTRCGGEFFLFFSFSSLSIFKSVRLPRAFFLSFLSLSLSLSLSISLSTSTPLSLPLPQVKPELANVSRLAESADVSLARAGFTSDCEAALNEQIK